VLTRMWRASLTLLHAISTGGGSALGNGYPAHRPQRPRIARLGSKEVEIG
jgi:hypothetical protein